MKKRLAMLGIGMLAVTACGANVATQSNRYTVQAKIHTASYWEPIAKGSTPTKIDHYDFHAEAWELRLKNTDGSVVDLKVSKSRYDKAKVGDRLVF